MTVRWPMVHRVVERTQALGRLLRGSMLRAPDDELDLRVGASVVLGLVGFVVGNPPVAILFAALVWAWPAFRKRKTRKREAAAIESVLPECVDLFRLATGAGYSIHQVVDLVVPHLPPAVAPVFVEVRRRVRLGVRLGDALDPLDDLGECFRPLAAALRSSAFDGVALTHALERVAADARLVRRRHAEERARKLPVRLLFPLITCILPAFGLLTVVPLLVASMPSLSF
jgi:tight adherence protein C